MDEEGKVDMAKGCIVDSKLVDKCVRVVGLSACG
jgi:hypothetical protein